jgi:hypothetical protein
MKSKHRRKCTVGALPGAWIIAQTPATSAMTGHNPAGGSQPSTVVTTPVP